MDRRVIVGSTLGLLAASPSLAAAQETEPSMDDRLAALEARIAELEDRVEVLESSAESTPNGEEAMKLEVPVGDLVSVSGVGTTVTDPVNLTQGRYRVNAEVSPAGQFSGFILYVYDPSGAEELLFNEILDGGGIHEMSTLYNAPEDGEYFFAAENVDGSWTITFEPM